jgi:transcriptional regulator with PAS, ATPase and Fis domain
MAKIDSANAKSNHKIAGNNQQRSFKKTGLRRRLEMFELIMENIYNGMMVTDADGYITHFNKPYGQFLGLDPEEQIGKQSLYGKTATSSRYLDRSCSKM